MFRLLNLKVKKREFNYQARHYDQDKEELQARIKNRKNKNKDGGISKSRIKREFGNMKGTAPRSFLNSAPFYRLLIILVALIAIAYFVLNNWLPQFMDMLFPEEAARYEMLDAYEE